jgi:CRP-like cAMP-binding protein
MRLRPRRDARDHDVVAALARAPLLTSVPGRGLRRLANEGIRRRFREGDVIVREETPGSTFFVVLSGCASVAVDGTIVRALGPGDSFGEIGAIGGGPRTATVVAATDVDCLALAPWLLRSFLASHAEAGWLLVQRVARLAA